MSKIRRIDFSPDEFLAGTAGDFSPEELGVYWMVCTLIYSRGGPIANDPEWIARKFKKTNPRTIKAALARLSESGKISRTDSELMVNRCRIELESSANRVRIAAESSSKRWRNDTKKHKNQSLTDAHPFRRALLTINHQPSTISGHMQKVETDKPENDQKERPSADSFDKLLAIAKRGVAA